MNLSSPRTALKLVTGPSVSQFCSRCGTPPRIESRAPRIESRVCAHCGLGLVLSSSVEVSSASIFLVLDVSGRVSAFSARAEQQLGISEQAVLGRPLQEVVAFGERFMRAPCGPPSGTLLVLESSAAPGDLEPSQ